MIVIPARRGAKNKALWKLNGIPLIDYALRACEGMDVLVDTDSEEVREYVSDRADVYMRPWYLGTDSSLVIDTIRSYAPDWVVLVQATAPFVTRDHIEACQWKAGFESVQTVVKVQHNAHWMNQRTMTGFIHDRAWNAQGKPAAYQFGDCLGFSKKAALERNPYLEPSLKIEIPRFHGVDIDDEEDLLLAEAILDKGLVVL